MIYLRIFHPPHPRPHHIFKTVEVETWGSKTTRIHRYFRYYIFLRYLRRFARIIFRNLHWHLCISNNDVCTPIAWENGKNVWIIDHLKFQSYVNNKEIYNINLEWYLRSFFFILCPYYVIIINLLHQNIIYCRIYVIIHNLNINKITNIIFHYIV